MDQSSFHGLGARMDSLDERIGRIEQQIGTLVTTVQKFTEALTDLVRVDERVAQLLLTNQHLGAKVEHQKELVTVLQVDLATIKARLDNMHEGGRDTKYWLGKVAIGVVGILVSMLLYKYGISALPGP